MTSQFTMHMEARDGLRKITVHWLIGSSSANVTNLITREHIGTIPVIADIAITRDNFQAYLDQFPWDEWFGKIGHGA